MFGRKNRRIAELERKLREQRDRISFLERQHRLEAERRVSSEGCRQVLYEDLKRADVRYQTLQGKYNKLKVGLKELVKV